MYPVLLNPLWKSELGEKLRLKYNVFNIGNKGNIANQVLFEIMEDTLNYAFCVFPYWYSIQQQTFSTPSVGMTYSLF